MQEQTTSKNTSAAPNEPEDFTQAAAASLMQQIEADKDQIIEINFEKMQAKHLEQYKNTLYEHLPEGIVIDNITNPQNPGRMLEEHELWEGELAAVTYTVGCYCVRSAIRVYREKKYHYTVDEYRKRIDAAWDELEAKENGEPFLAPLAESFRLHFYRRATQEELARVRDQILHGMMGVRSIDGYRTVNEVSAAYVSDGVPGDYRHICYTQFPEGGGFTDTITFIGTVKINKPISDDRADLFVGTCYTGSSYSIETWYAFSADGRISEFCIHGMDPDSRDAKWDWKGDHSDLK